MATGGFCRKSSLYFSDSQMNIGQLSFLKTVIVGLAVMIIGCQGQTFQYSRGWTNGKRGGYGVGNSGAGTVGSQVVTTGGQPGPLFEVENAGVPPMEESNLPVSSVPSSGTLRMNVNGPEGRLRSLDYAQYLNRKFGTTSTNGNGNHKPVWILGVDQESTGNGEF